MNKFIRRVIIFFLPLVVIGISIEILLRSIPNDYSYKRSYLDENSQKLDVLFLGSSHVFYGINPNYIKLNSFNASYISQSLDYDFEILKKYSEKLDSLKYLVLAVDYFSLFNRLENGIESWRVKNYAIYYNIKPSINILNNTELFGNNFKLNLIKLFEFYYLKESIITCSRLGYGIRKNKTTRKNLFISAKDAAKRHRAKNNIYYNDNLQILNSILSYGKKKNINIILYTSPAYKTYTDIIDTNQLNITLDVLNKFAKNNNVTYVNFLKNETFTKNDFQDADHLNDIGAKKLSIKIDSLINFIRKK